MKKFLLIVCLFFLVNPIVNAICHSSRQVAAPMIVVDLSDKINKENPIWDFSTRTLYEGAFNCSTRNSEFSYTALLSSEKGKESYIGFHDGQYWVQMEIVDTPKNITLTGAGSHTAAELNKNFKIRFSLLKREQARLKIKGGTHYFDDIMFVSDMSGMSPLDIFFWPIKMLAKITGWVLSGFKNWPYETRDMFIQPLQVTYNPKPTTCQLKNSNLDVALPNANRSQLNKVQPSYTPFQLNINCSSIKVDGTTNRSIKMFLSSNNLLATDSSVLIDPSANAAKGVGLRVVQASATQPVRFSPSNINPENATLLVNYAASGPVAENFNIDLGVYYYPYQPTAITAGKINTSATLNIIYD